MSSLIDMAAWIHTQMGDPAVSGDDIYDVLLGNITRPESLVSEVRYLASQYTDEHRRQDERRRKAFDSN